MSTISTLPETYELTGAHMSAKRGTDPHEYQSVTFYTPQNEHTAHSAPGRDGACSAGAPSAIGQCGAGQPFKAARCADPGKG